MNNMPLHVKAFDYAHQALEDATNNYYALRARFWEIVDDYIEAYSTDRRYKLTINAATASNRSALITYRGQKCHVHRLGNVTEWWNDYEGKEN